MKFRLYCIGVRFRRMLLWAIAQGLTTIANANDKNVNSTPVKGDILDSLIGVVIILFILSVITEKLTQLIRKYSPFIRPGDKLHRTKASSLWKNIRKKQTDGTVEDDKIEREVNSLSFIIGLLIAIIFCVDLFQMFVKGSPSDYLYWSTERFNYYTNCKSWYYNVPILLISFCLTGFFLTFGSKFFHDLLDMLFQVKNLKRKMVDANTFDVDSIQQFDEYLDKTYSDLIAMAINQNRNMFKVQDAVSPPMHGRMRYNGRLVDCIDIHLQGTNRYNIPQSVPVKLDSGRTVLVKVNVILNVEKPAAMVRQGNSTASSNSKDFVGTICCKVLRNGEPVLLTCSHVLTGGIATNLRGPIQPAPAQIENKDLGAFIYGLCTDEFDIALLEGASNNFEYKIEPKKERRPTQTDIRNTKVRVVCRGEKTKNGIVTNDRVTEPIEIQYKENTTNSLVNLLVISEVSESNGETTYKGVSEPGDSGACVYDENDMPIGMIVAGNKSFSYAIPIVAILNKISGTIIK